MEESVLIQQLSITIIVHISHCVYKNALQTVICGYIITCSGVNEDLASLVFGIPLSNYIPK